jgi:maltose O-acetyltransferase
MASGDFFARALLQAAYRYNRARSALLRSWLGGRLEVDPSADVWASCLRLTGSGRAWFGPGTVLERMPFPLILDLAAGSNLRFGDRTWVRGKYRPNVITCFENAAVVIGPDSLINGAVISARRSVVIGARANISWDVAILDSDLHCLDNDSALKVREIVIGDHVLIGTGATVLAGASIGSHSVIGAGSIVTGSIPDHVVAAGAPARVVRAIADRDRV